MKLFTNFLLLSLATFSFANEEQLSADERREQLRKKGGRALQGGDGGDSGSGGDGGGSDACFSGLNTVEVQGKGFISMNTVEIGDLIRAGNDAFSPVIGFGKREHEKVSQYVQLISEGLEETPLELTKEHMVFVSGKAVPAIDVRVGDMLGEHQVKEINQVIRRGAYAPVTESGDLMVGGVLASCYTAMLDFSFFDRHAAHHAFMAPFRAGWISNWNYDGDRAQWIKEWAPFLSSVKYQTGPATQYLLSLGIIGIYAVASAVFFVQNFALFLNLAIVGYGAYRAYKHTSKVKNA